MRSLLTQHLKKLTQSTNKLYRPAFAFPSKDNLITPTQDSFSNFSTRENETKTLDKISSEESVISVDRSGLSQVPEHGSQKEDHEDSPLTRHLKALIEFRNGPITVAEYMEEVLVNPVAGFYMNRDVFGAGGDFVTSPDISQMFGEMIGVWCVATWQQMGSPEKFQIVELGPGRGTLMADLLRGTSKFQDFSKAAEIFLIEVSPALRSLQWKALKCDIPLNYSGKLEDGKFPESGVSELSGANVNWQIHLESVPRGIPTLVIAHEFFDALPIHQFQKTEKGWREKLVDVAEPSSPYPFQFVLSPTSTAASSLILPRRLSWVPRGDPWLAQANQVEVCPGALRLSTSLADRLAKDGGAALIIDYGEGNYPIEDSLQAIKKHKFVNIFDSPGESDLSAYVDFQAIKKAAEESGTKAICQGPIPQNKFLWSLGINFRLEALLRNASPLEARDLRRGYWRLMGEGKGSEGDWGEIEDGEEGQEIEGMGGVYKALVISSENLKPNVGFL